MNDILTYNGPELTFVEVGNITVNNEFGNFVNWQMFPKQPNFNMFFLTIKSF